jgi:putative heme-binding domain-containing protein
VGPGQQAKLSFTAPEEPGDYAYVCTFPGHWRRMVGTLAVVKDVDAYLAAHGPAAPPKMTEWKIADLAGDISKLDANRNLPHGRELFTKLACANCHKVGPMGVSYGPELTDIFPQYRYNAADVLRQILEPSLIISNRYRAFDFELNNGDELAGMVVKEEDETMTVQTGPSPSLFRTLKKSDIKKRVPRTTSIMPTGLLNTLSVDDILDLLEFLRAGGNITAHEHPH